MTELRYDANSRITEVERWHFDANGPVGDGAALTRFVYDGPGRQIGVIDDVGATTLTRRDGLGRVDQIVHPTGGVETYAYDHDGRRVTRTAPAPTPTGKIATRRVVNAWGQPVLEEQLTSGNAFAVATWAYDPYGRLLSRESARGDAFEVTTYDPFDRLRHLSFNRGTATEQLELVYDTLDRVTARGSDAGDGKMRWTLFDRDLLGRVERVVLPDGEAETLAYIGPTALVETRVDRRGHTSTHGYDPTGRPASVTTFDPTSPGEVWSRSFTYDPLGRVLLAAASGDPLDPGDDVDSHFTYDSLGGRTGEWNNLLGATKGVSHRYDGRGLPEHSVLAGTVVDRDFDGIGRLGSLTLDNEPAPAVAWTYAGLGGPETIQRQSGVSTTYAYNDLGQLVGQQVAGPAPLSAWRWELGLDGVPRLAEQVRGGTMPNASVFRVGVGGRLEAENHGLAGLSGVKVPLGATAAAANAAVAGYLSTGTRWRTYTLDGRGNWLQRAAGDFTLNVSPTLGASDAYQQFGSAPIAYDEGGSLTRRGATVYGRDAFDRVSTLTAPGLGRRYVYDALGRIVAEDDTVTGTRTLYGWDGLRRAVRETPNGVDVTVQTDRDKHAIYIDPTGERFDLHQDRLGSVFLATDATGAAREWYDYSAYGEISVLSPTLTLLATSAIGNRFGFQGQQHDPATGLVQMRNRFLDPEIGRFLAMDPLGHDGGGNRYAFVDSAPTAFTDSLGLCKDAQPGCPGNQPNAGGDAAGPSGDPRLEPAIDLEAKLESLPPGTKRFTFEGETYFVVEPLDIHVSGRRYGPGSAAMDMFMVDIGHRYDAATVFDRSDRANLARRGEAEIGQTPYFTPEAHESANRTLADLERDWRADADVIVDFDKNPKTGDVTITFQGPYGTRRIEWTEQEAWGQVENWETTMNQLFDAMDSTLQPPPWDDISPAAAAGSIFGSAPLQGAEPGLPEDFFYPLY